MTSYLALIYITLDQETALRDLFVKKGWQYCKIDLSSTTDVLGPSLTTDTTCLNKPQTDKLKNTYNETKDDETADDENVDDVDIDMNVNEKIDDSTITNDTTAAETTQSTNMVTDSTEQVTQQSADVTQNGHLCPECGKTFQKPQSLTAHLEMHSVETHGTKRRFICTVKNCGKSFSRKTHWVFHMNIHEKRTPYVCEYCGRSYTSQYSHKRHILVCHTGDGGRCSVCGKAILEKEALLAHKAACFMKSALRCKLCGAVFKWRSALNRHRRKHDEIRVTDKRFDKNYIDYTGDPTCQLQNIGAFQQKPRICSLKQAADTRFLLKSDSMMDKDKGSGQLETCQDQDRMTESATDSVKSTNNVKIGETSSSVTQTKKEYFCKDCNKMFKWKQSYSKHRKTKHGGNVTNHNEAVTKDTEITPRPLQVSGVRQNIVIYYPNMVNSD